MIRFLTKPIVLGIHDRSLQLFGGAQGLRDDGLLESGLNRPLNKNHFEGEEDILTLGVAYAFGLGRNHPFLDGNKRTALGAMDVFLRLNGESLKALSDEALYRLMIDICTGALDEGQAISVIRDARSLAPS